MQRYRWAAWSASLLAAGLMSATTATTAFAQTPYNMTMDTILMNGRLMASADGFVQQGTTYMPIYYVMKALQLGMNITSHWSGGRWDLQVPDTVAPQLDGTPIGHGNTDVYINGVLVAQVNTIVTPDPAAHAPTTYMPIWYVMQVLQRLHVVSAWDGMNWKMFSGVPDDELAAYKKAHPTYRIGCVASAPLTAGAGQSLIVENNPGLGNAPVTVSVVSPNMQVTDFKTSLPAPELIQVIPQSSGNLIAAYTGGEDIDTAVTILKTVDQSPMAIQTLHGINGVMAWLQDGTPMMLVSNPTANVITGPNGQQDAVEMNTVYTFQNGAFTATSTFRSGMYNYQPTLDTNPQAAVVSALNVLPIGEKTATDSLSIFSDGRDPLVHVSTQFLTDVQAVWPTLAAMLPPSESAVPALHQVSQGVDSQQYAVQMGGHELYFTVSKNGPWTLTGFRVATIAAPPTAGQGDVS